ncbi:rod shape-determining protein [Oceaniserpentilla sp. 4NH20-0058]|uniref:rod shape-determining protein MreB n=1 Tax=Oceaniserpentilla sp. 4NH20-0058 TaxID=3127660 RepID=UPI00310A55B2
MGIATFICGLFSNDLYVQVWEKRLKVSNINTKKIYEIEPLMATETTTEGHRRVFKIGSSCKSLDTFKYQITNPFSHPRSLLADFQVAEKMLQFAFLEQHKSNFLTPAPRVIIHPMEKLEGGLTNIEKKAFRELCIGAGVRQVVVYAGPELSLHNIDFDKIKEKDDSVI